MHHGKMSMEIAAWLLKLRERIGEAQIPSSKIDGTLSIATWNVREFGKKRQTTVANPLRSQRIRHHAGKGSKLPPTAAPWFGGATDSSRTAPSKNLSTPGARGRAGDID